MRYRLEYAVEFDLEDESVLVAGSPAVRGLPDLQGEPTLQRWRDVNAVLHASLEQAIASSPGVRVRTSECALEELDG